MEDITPVVRGLESAQIEQFISDGFVRIDQAFPREARTRLERFSGRRQGAARTIPRPGRSPSSDWACSRRRRSSKPRTRHGCTPPSISWSVRDAGVDRQRWGPSPCGSLLPSIPATLDGTSTSASAPDTPDFMSWRANIHSKGRALLMLFLFSDVGERDAPTRIRVGSHADIARQLAPAGEQGLTLGELAADGFATSAHRPVVTATGDAGTVYLCHPFLVHAAQPHQGEHPRFLAQPPLLPVDPDNRPHGDLNRVEQATARALGRRP